MSRSHAARGSAARVTALAIALVAHSAQPALAQSDASQSEAGPGASGSSRPARAALPAKPSDAPPPSCLTPTLSDQLRDTLQARGVQKRPFLKNKQVVLMAHGGLFSADLLSSSYLYGGGLGFFLTEDFGFELSLGITPVALDLDKPLAEFFGDERFDPTTAYLAMGNLVWSPIHAKLKIGGSILYSDILFSAGTGRLFHDSVQGMTFNAGAMLDVFVTQWVTLRLTIRDIIAVQEAVGETRLTNNILTTLGVALWIPTGL